MFPPAIARALPKCLDWETVTLKNGQSFEGCKVGPLVEENTHFDGIADKACARWASGGVLQCGACEKFSASPLRGYLPCLTKLGERRVVLLSETVCPKVKNLAQGTALRFTRPNTGKRAVSVQLLGGQGRGSCNDLPFGANCIPADKVHCGGDIAFAPDGAMCDHL